MKEPARYGRNTRAYRRKAARLKRTNTICWLCGHDIDPDLPPTHPKSYTADHVAPLATGGHILGELRPAHRDCNTSKGTGTTTKKQPTSRPW